MDTVIDPIAARGCVPLTEAEVAAERHELPSHLGTLPFVSGAASRSLWVVYVGKRWIWTHAVLPVDDRLDMPDQARVKGLSEIVAMSIGPPLCRGDEEALVVLRRPGPAAVSQADAYVFRLVCEAAAGRQTAPWTFHVAGPDGARECFRGYGHRADASCLINGARPEEDSSGRAPRSSFYETDA